MLKKFNTFKSVFKRARVVLSNQYDLKIVIYFLMAIIGGILEIMSIGLLIPAIYVLTGAQDSQISLYINNFFDYVNINEKNEQLLFIMILLCLSYFIKNTFLAYVYWVQVNITTFIQTNLSNSFFSKFLNKSTLYHSRKNSATIIRDVLSETSQFAKGFILNILTVILDSIILIFVFCVILLIDIKAGLIISIFFLIIALFFVTYFKNLVKKWGELRQHNERERLKNIQESLGSLREIKILGKVPVLREKFNYFNTKLFLIMRNSSLITTYPKLCIEFLLVLFVSLILFYFLRLEYSFERIIVILGVVGACSFRLMPIITKIINSINMIQYSKPSLDALYEYFLDNKIEDQDYEYSDNNKEIKFKNNLELENISFTYSSRDNLAVKNINLKVNSGDVIGIIGTTGSGKSTLIDLILGLIKPMSGDIKVDNLSVLNNRPNWNKMIGYVPQNIFLLDDTIKNNIVLGTEEAKINENRISELIKICNLENLISGLPSGINTIVGERGARISGGQKQRIGLARALYRNPLLLIFDEATNALDLKNEQEIMEKILGEKERTSIIITHRLETLKFCKFVYKIEDGKLHKINI